MTRINHERPYFKYIDNIKREISELDALCTSENVSAVKKVVTTTTSENKKRPITALDRKIHHIGCSILAHMERTGDCSLCNKLIASLKGARKTAVIDWFCATGRFTTFNPKTQKHDYNLSVVKKQKIDRNAEAKPFWEYMPEIKRRVFRFEDEMMKIISACEKRLANPVRDPRDNIDPVVLGKLKALLKSRK